MYTDALLRLSGTTVAGGGVGQTLSGTAVSTNAIDLTQHSGIGAEVGEGKPLFFAWTVGDAFVRAAGALTVTFNIITDDDVALGSPVVLASTGAIAKADLTAGAQIFLQIPPKVASLGLRYLGASYTVSATPDTGTIFCDIVETIQDGKKFYPAGYSVTP